MGILSWNLLILEKNIMSPFMHIQDVKHWKITFHWFEKVKEGRMKGENYIRKSLKHSESKQLEVI
jgi:hypothetical protein